MHNVYNVHPPELTATPEMIFISPDVAIDVADMSIPPRFVRDGDNLYLLTGEQDHRERDKLVFKIDHAAPLAVVHVRDESYVVQAFSNDVQWVGPAPIPPIYNVYIVRLDSLPAVLPLSLLIGQLVERYGAELTTPQVTIEAGVSPRTIYRAIEAGRLTGTNKETRNKRPYWTFTPEQAAPFIAEMRAYRPRPGRSKVIP